jgi:hypothetical protein
LSPVERVANVARVEAKLGEEGELVDRERLVESALLGRPPDAATAIRSTTHKDKHSGKSIQQGRTPFLS